MKTLKRGQVSGTVNVDTAVTLSNPQTELIPVMVSVREDFLSGP